MPINIITPESELVTALIEASEFQRGLVRDGHLARCPSDSLLDSRPALASLVNTLFWTSLAAEEGRAVTGSICICSPEQAPRSRAFECAELLTLKSLISLMTASPDAPLAVHLDGNELKIWGVLDSRPLLAVTLRVGGTGTVVAMRHQETVALLHEGCVHLTKRTGGTSLMLLLAEALELQTTFPNRMTLAHNLAKVIVAMHSHHHGGAIVITPSTGGHWRDSVDWRFQFTAGSSSCLPDLLAAMEKSSATSDAQVLDAQIALLHKTLRSVGQLTSIDGALVLREDLKILGFGAKLNSPLAEFTVSRFNATTQEHLKIRPLSELGGTRHQSAARFVNQHHDCSVVVSSQDGRLTLVAWVHDPGNVVAVSGLEHFVWGELP